MSPDKPRSVSADDGRHESPAERLDRNWGELLQELRVTQTGIQILFAFLLILPFQARFAILNHNQVILYVAIVALITAAMVCIVTPVILHRLLFRHRAKDVLVKASNVLTVIGIGFLGIALTCAVGLVVDVAIGRTAGYVASAVLAVVVLLVWVALPMYLLRRSSGRYE